jgi:ribonuclease R
MSKKSKIKDPHAKREASKYDDPIASREFIMEVLDKSPGPMNREEIAAAIKIKTDNQFEALRRRLRAMERDGQIVYTRRGGFGLASKMDLIRGRVIGHPDGFGFLVPEEGGDDLFLTAREMQALMHGDRIVAHVRGIDRRGRREAAVVEVLERAMKQVVGRLFIESGVGFVVPDNKRLTQDILVPEEMRYGAKHGQMVTLEIIEYAGKYRQAIGRVVEILGEHMAPGMEIDIAIRSYDLPQQLSLAAEAEAAGFTEMVSEQDKQGRTDIRHLPLVTIDGEDARDFDDAVYCEPQGKGWRLIVAIADVSHYIKPGMALDADARERGTSVYFPERVIPMLPEIISNGLCSLKPKVDRLCMVCDMSIGEQGQLKGFKFYDAVMHSHARLTYNKVNAMIEEGDEALRREYADFIPPLENLYALFDVLHRARVKRGAIEFDSTETRIIFGEERKIESIVPVSRNNAHRLIEECMLMANVAAANYLLENDMPALFRIHEKPGEEKLTDLRQFLSEFGLTLGGGDEPEPRHYTKLLEAVKGRRDAHLIQTVMLRSMKQAVYSPDNVGHFGLAYTAYAHFTSPIRRYPDLLVHRAIRHLNSGGNADNFHYEHNDMAVMGEHCSMTERRADEATRDAVDWLKCEFMLDKVGQEFEGIISSVTGFGLFVELLDIYIEGLVHITALKNDYYHFDPVAHLLMGEDSGRVYRLGDPIRVAVARVDLDDRKIDFILSEQQPELAVETAAHKNRSGRPAPTSKKSKRRGRRRGKDSGSDAKEQPTGKKSGSKKKATKKKSSKKKGGTKKKGTQGRRRRRS